MIRFSPSLLSLLWARSIFPDWDEYQHKRRRGRGFVYFDGISFGACGCPVPSHSQAKSSNVLNRVLFRNLHLTAEASELRQSGRYLLRCV